MHGIGRRRFLVAAGALATAPLVRARTGKSKPTLGLLSADPPRTADELARSPFTAKLRSLGWVEGENLRIERAYASGQIERLPEFAEALVRKGVDVIWAISPPAAVAAARATRTVPIVFARVVWPIELGLRKSLAHPDGNVTGVASIADPAVLMKPVEYLLEVAKFKRGLAIVPGRVIYKTVSGGTFSPPGMAEIERIADRLGVERNTHYVNDVKDIDAAFANALESRCEAMYVTASPLLYAQRKRLADFAIRNRLPSAFIESGFVEAGGLLSYGSDPWATIFQSLDYVDRILHGARPAEMPIQLPTKMELVINLKTASSLGLAIPQSLLLRANRVIE